MTSGADVTATFCATLADEWVRGGVTDAVVCPGSRSTPLARALADESRLRVHMHHDERSAGFLALGLGSVAGRPAVVLTTSGTAAAELHPAVVEAHEAGIPMVVATADRPPELQDVGAPQTIDQTHLFGSLVRWFAEPGVPDDITRGSWRALASRSLGEATGADPGPVHLNLAFREPLLGAVGALPPGRDDGRPWTTCAPAAGRGGAGSLDHLMPGVRGVVVAGAGTTHPELVHRLAARLGWPVLADPRSGARLPRATTVAAADALLRSAPLAARLEPEVVLRLGEPAVSKVVNQWLDRSAARQVLVHPRGRTIDPAGVLEQVICADPGTVCAGLLDRCGPGGSDGSGPWLGAWQAAESAAQAAIQSVLAAHPEPTEPGIARAVLASLPDGANLFTSSSMPVRDVEWFGEPRERVRVWANRGANGIDGVTSTAVGVALASRAPTVALLGDIAFLHDTNGLLGLAGRAVDLTVVVVDNDGGGIFSFLPQRASVDPRQFERLFGTPHGVDLAGLARAHGLAVSAPTTAAEVGPVVAEAVAAGGVRVVIVRTDRNANVAVHDEIHEAVAAAVTRSG